MNIWQKKKEIYKQYEKIIKKYWKQYCEQQEKIYREQLEERNKEKNLCKIIK